MEGKVMNRWSMVKVVGGVQFAAENLVVRTPSDGRHQTRRCLRRLDEADGGFQRRHIN